MKKSEKVALAQFFLNAPRCGARSRRNNYKPCRQPAMKNGRCRLHGGLSTGPKTLIGKKLSAKANFKNGLYTKKAIAEKEQFKEILEWAQDYKNLL